MFEVYLSGNTSAKQLEDFFSSGTWKLLNRVAEKELPYNYAELMIKWEQMYRCASVSPAAVAEGSSLEKQLKDIVQRMMDGSAGNTSRKFKPNKSYSSWCLNFNMEVDCIKPDHERGRLHRKSGKDLKHGCNICTRGSHCNSLDHNRFSQKY